MNSNGKQNKKEETINVFGYISLFFSTRFHDSEEVVDDDYAVGNEGTSHPPYGNLHGQPCYPT